MPRGRFISREISLDEKVESLPDDSARLLWTWMILHLDREGRIQAEPHVIKSIVAPRRSWSSKKISFYLNSFVTLGLVLRYNVGKYSYLQSTNFKDHQVKSALDKESLSVIPPPESGVSRELVKRSSSVTLGKDKEQVKVKDKDKDKEEEEDAGDPMAQLNDKDLTLIWIWKAVSNFSLSDQKCMELVDKLHRDFPDVDLIEESQKWATYKLDNPLGKNSNTSLQIWNWMNNTKKYNGKPPSRSITHVPTSEELDRMEELSEKGEKS